MGVVVVPEIDNEKFKVTEVDVFRVIQSRKSIANDPIQMISKPIASIRKSSPWLLRLFKDIYSVDSTLFMVHIGHEFWNAIYPTICLWTSNWLLTSIEQSFAQKDSDLHLQVVWALCARFLLLVVQALIYSYCKKTEELLSAKIKFKFQEMDMDNKLHFDLKTYNEESQKATNEDVTTSLRTTVEFFKEVCSIVVQLLYLSSVQQAKSSRMSGSTSSLFFTAACMVTPVWDLFSDRHSLWTTVWISHVTNPAFLRVKTLSTIVKNSEYIQELIANDLASYIISEYRAARKTMGNLSGCNPYTLFNSDTNPAHEVFSLVSRDLPTLFYGISYILDPSSVSISSLALLQQSSSSLQNAFWQIQYYGGKLPRTLESLEKIYKSEQLVQKVLEKNGTVLFPPVDFAKEKGMQIELRNITFKYPTTKKTKPALQDISLTIKSGEFIVVVGANGSGKSTIVKLLNRLYDVEDGQVIIDGLPIEKYNVSTLRHAIADLSQEHHLLPFSIRENIGIGYAAEMNNAQMIRDAAEKGGALPLVEGFQDKFDTIINPVSTKYWSAQEDTDMSEMAKQIEKNVDTSGGERQRLVASRVFMRLNSPAVKLVTVDEPSSAMDPEGEFKLFEQLRKAQEGRTMLLVTHRFGHLTPYADQIICMKDGKIVEQGSHTHLLSLDGEYAKLYKIQARAYDGSGENTQPETPTDT